MRSDIERSRDDKRRIVNNKLHRSNNAYIRRRNEIDWLEEFLLKEFTMVEDGISSALRCPGKWIYNSCLRCLTEFGVMVSPDQRKVTIQAWHNFGMEGSPMDISWKVNVADKEYQLVTMSPYLDYIHGSIRELWLSGGSNMTETEN